MEHPEKLETAIVAYLKTITWPDAFDEDLILPGESDDTKEGQCVIVNCGDAEEETPLMSGNKWHTVTIELRTPSAESAQLDDHSAAAEVLESAILVDDLPDQFMATAADLTVFGVRNIIPLREQTENYWMSGFSLRVYSCPTSFS